MDYMRWLKRGRKRPQENIFPSVMDHESKIILVRGVTRERHLVCRLIFQLSLVLLRLASVRPVPHVSDVSTVRTNESE